MVYRANVFLCLLFCLFLIRTVSVAYAVTIDGVDVEDIGIKNTSWRLEPSFEYKDDSLGRESWSLKKTIRAALFQRYGLIAGYHHSAYKENGVEAVNDDAGLLGLDAETPGKNHFGEALFELHHFSDKIDIPFSFKSQLRSQWTSWFRSHFRVGREPYPSATTLHQSIKETFVESNLFWRPIKAAEFRWLGKTEFISDNNRIYTQEAETSVRIPKIDGLQAIYLFTIENSSNQSFDYYTPNRVKQHQFGGDFYYEKEKIGYIYCRYLFGYGKSAWDDARWTIHTVTISSGVYATEKITLGPSFSWGKTPSYESKTYNIFGRLEF